MGTKTTESESTSSIKGRTGEENAALAAFERLMSGAEGQMGDISGLASGDISASPQDLALLQQAVMASRGIAERSAAQAFEESTRMVEEDALSKGIAGSSIEAVNRAIGGREFQRTMADVGARGQQTMAQGAMQLPLQRAGIQLSANNLLLQRLTGGAGALLQHGLQERLAQQTTSGTQETSGFTAGDVMGLGGQIGGAILTPGPADVAEGTP